MYRLIRQGHRDYNIRWKQAFVSFRLIDKTEGNEDFSFVRRCLDGANLDGIGRRTVVLR